MPIRTDKPSTDNKPQRAVGERNPTMLTEAELHHVAAAGSKPALMGGSGAAAH